jgi:hypothetical protein
MQGKGALSDVTVAVDAADFTRAYARMHMEMGDWANWGALALLVIGTIAVVRTGPSRARWALLLVWGLYIQLWSVQLHVMSLLVVANVIPLPMPQ